MTERMAATQTKCDPAPRDEQTRGPTAGSRPSVLAGFILHSQLISRTTMRSLITIPNATRVHTGGCPALAPLFLRLPYLSHFKALNTHYSNFKTYYTDNAVS